MQDDERKYRLEGKGKAVQSREEGKTLEEILEHVNVLYWVHSRDDRYCKGVSWKAYTAQSKPSAEHPSAIVHKTASW